VEVDPSMETSHAKKREKTSRFAVTPVLICGSMLVIPLRRPTSNSPGNSGLEMPTLFRLTTSNGSSATDLENKIKIIIIVMHENWKLGVLGFYLILFILGNIHNFDVKGTQVFVFVHLFLFLGREGGLFD